MKKNYEAKQTETISINVRWKDADGVPFPLSKASFTFKKHAGPATSDNPVIFELTEDDGITLDEFGWVLVLGSVGMSVPAATYKYDLLVRRENDDFQKVLLEGEFLIKAGVSEFE